MDTRAEKPLKVLIVDDAPTDAEIVEHTLRKAGLHFLAKRVSSREDFTRALDSFEPDVVLSDYNLPGFGGLAALQIAHDKRPDVPVIEVTGALGDEAAVELMRIGAADYVLKDRLARLPFAIERALAKADEEYQRRSAQQALLHSEERYRTLVNATSQLVWTKGPDGRVTDDIPTWRAFTGQDLAQTQGDGWIQAIHPEDRVRAVGAWRAAADARRPYLIEVRMRRHDGEYRYMTVRGAPVLDGDGRIREWIGTCEDITDRKTAEQALRRTNRMLKTLTEGNVTLVRATREAELLSNMCRVLVDCGGYRLAWIGRAVQDAQKTLEPAAGWGEGFESLNPGSSGPAGTALKTGEPQIVQDLAAEPHPAPPELQARERGCASMAALPLKDGRHVFGVLAIYARQAHAFDDDELGLLREFAGDLAYGIKSLRERVNREAAEQRWRASLETTVGAIASTLEIRDPYTGGHQRRVAQLAAAIGRELHLPEHQIEGIYLAGLIHDIGKIHVPSEILSKPGRLSPLEYQIIQTHAAAGYEIVKGVDFPWPIAQAILQHHERLDGSGYPNRLKADQIIVEAKILAVADVVEAMTSRRPYREGLGLERALEEILQGKGQRYDPGAVDACCRLFNDLGFRFQ